MVPPSAILLLRWWYPCTERFCHLGKAWSQDPSLGRKTLAPLVVCQYNEMQKDEVLTERGTSFWSGAKWELVRLQALHFFLIAKHNRTRGSNDHPSLNIRVEVLTPQAITCCSRWMSQQGLLLVERVSSAGRLTRESTLKQTASPEEIQFRHWGKIFSYLEHYCVYTSAFCVPFASTRPLFSFIEMHCCHFNQSKTASHV